MFINIWISFYFYIFICHCNFSLSFSNFLFVFVFWHSYLFLIYFNFNFSNISTSTYFISVGCCVGFHQIFIFYFKFFYINIKFICAVWSPYRLDFHTSAFLYTYAMCLQTKGWVKIIFCGKQYVSDVDEVWLLLLKIKATINPKYSLMEHVNFVSYL